MHLMIKNVQITKFGDDQNVSKVTKKQGKLVSEECSQDFSVLF